MNDVAKRLQASTAHRLARLLALEEAEVTPWGRLEMAQVLGHQLGAPLRLGLVDCGPTIQAVAPALGTEESLTLDTFEKVLFHSHPPVELLHLIKDFAKAHLAAQPAALPAEVAGVLYFSAIAAGLAKCNQRISQLSDQDLRRGINWALAFDWVDHRLRLVLRAALASVGSA